MDFQFTITELIIRNQIVNIDVRLSPEGRESLFAKKKEALNSLLFYTYSEISLFFDKFDCGNDFVI